MNKDNRKPKMNGLQFESIVIEKMQSQGWKCHKVHERLDRKNEFLDLVAARDGSVIMIEVKIVRGKSISIGGDKGIRENQIDIAFRWETAGVKTIFVIGFEGGEKEMVFPGIGVARWAMRGNKSINLNDEDAIEQLAAQAFFIVNENVGKN